MCSRIILIIIVFLINVFCVCGASDDETQSLDSILEVNTVKCDCGHQHDSHLKIVNKETGLSKVYENGLKRIDEKKWLDDKLIIVGEGMSNIPLVCIINRNTLELIDSFYCYYPKISNDKKHLFGVKFVARYGPERSADQIVFKYDIEKLKNETIEKVDSGSIKKIVGSPIYPESNKRENTFDASEINPKDSGTLRGTFEFPKNDSAVFLYLKGETLDFIYVDLEKSEMNKVNLSMRIRELANDKDIKLKRVKMEKCLIEDNKVSLTTNVIEELKTSLTFEIELTEFILY